MSGCLESFLRHEGVTSSTEDHWRIAEVTNTAAAVCSLFGKLSEQNPSLDIPTLSYTAHAGCID